MPQPAAAQPSVAGGEQSAAPPGFEAESDTGNWIVRFAQPSLARYAGQIDGLPATSPAVTGAETLDVEAPASVAYLDHLAGVQDTFVGSMEDTLDRSVDVPFRYRNVLNGMAVTVSAEEAARLSELPGVASVTPDAERELVTDTSHPLIGSPAFWDGQTGPSAATRGEGVVVGVIDTGVNAPHPSFAEVSPGDGFVHENPFGSGTFVGACDPADPNHQPVCNDKLIGAYNLNPAGPNFPSVLDWNDHGSHTASTAAGNLHDATFPVGQTELTRTVQGVAPRANVISYLICDPQCPNSSAVAAVDQAIVDGVDVLNYSISGTDNPWVDVVDQAFLDAFEAGIFVAASAGNDGANSVAKTGPWNASVAASTHQRIFAQQVDVTSAGAPPELSGLPAAPGNGPQLPADLEAETRFVESNPLGCNAFPAGAFEGSIALIERGACNFSVKVLNAEAAGAVAVLLFNNVGGPPVAPAVAGTGTSVPSAMLDQADGQALRDFVIASADPVQVRIGAAVTVANDPVWEDVMAGFSSTGPSQFEMLAPTFAAPGVNILAAAHDTGGDPNRYTLLQGTSMSSPHGAGSGALLASLHPDWTPAQVRSALASTADPAGVRAPDGDTPATQFNLGSGRLDLTSAARIGLTMDETTANFEAADPNLGGDPKTLNLPAFIDHTCATCSWDRTVTSVADTPASYTVEVDAPDGMAVTVTPSEFTIAPGASADIQVSVDASALPEGEWAFADVRLVTTDSHAGGAPIASVHYPIGVVAEAVQQAPEITVDPDEITAVQGPDETVTHELTIGNTGDANLDWTVFENAPTRLPEGSTPVATGPAPGEPTGDASLSSQQTLLRGVFGPPAPQMATPQAQPTQGEITLTHSQSQAIQAQHSVACSSDEGQTTTDNGYLRHFALDDFGVSTEFEVTEVSFGVEVLRPAAQDLTVNLFTMIDPDGPFTYPNFDPIGSATQSVPPQELTLVTVPVTGTAPAHSTLVVEIDAPSVDGTGAFFIGSNPNGQTAPSYLRSVSCQLPQPTDLAGVKADMHVVMNVHGNGETAEPECQVPSGTPWVDLDQTSGTVAPFGEQVVEVTFDSTGLSDGEELTANLCLASNDPANPLVQVPITLQVEQVATPVIEVTPESLSAEVAEGGSTEQTLSIGNLGDAPLDWNIFADEPQRLPSGSTQVRPTDPPTGTTLVGLGTSASGGVGASAVPEAAPAEEAEVTITHSASQDILPQNSVACTPDNNTTTDNGYLRHFVLEDFDIASAFEVTEVAFGIEVINGPPHPVTVNLFRMIDPAGPFVYANFELLGTAEQTFPAQSQTVVEMPVSGTAPAGSTLVVEVETPDLRGQGGFFVGSNAGGQTAPSFFRSAACSIPEPVNLGEIGFANMHIVMNVTGLADVTTPPCTAPGDVPWLALAPDSGSTAAGATSDVTVSFDASGLEPGEFEALLCVASNDPATPLVQVPVSLTVTEDPGGTICDETIVGVHDGPLTVESGTTCLAAGSQVRGEVNVAEGAGLIATAAVIQGPVSAVGAALVDMAFTQVTGPVLVFGATDRVSLFANQVTGSVSLLNGVTGDPTAVSGNTVIGTLSCFGNQPPPTDHGLSNTATGGKLGQCTDL